MLPLLLDKYFLKNYTSLPAVYKAGFLVFLTHLSESGPVGRRSVNHMNKEKLTILSDAKSQYVKSWADISSRLPDNLNPHYKKFIRDYFRAQLRLQIGQNVKARRIFSGLDKRVGFREFEDKHQPLLAAIDIAVRGTTFNKVAPSFAIEED